MGLFIDGAGCRYGGLARPLSILVSSIGVRGLACRFGRLRICGCAGIILGRSLSGVLGDSSKGR